jgi:hypothetical protein
MLQVAGCAKTPPPDALPRMAKGKVILKDGDVSLSLIHI